MSAQVINGVNVERVARIVSGKKVLGATHDEWHIADIVRRYGEKLERDGYMPAFRRQAMLRLLSEEAQKAKGHG